MTDHRTQTRLALHKAGILPAKPRAGCPPLPALAFGTDGVKGLADYLSAAERAHADGHGLALLLAVQTLAMWAPDQPLPSWIRRGLANAVQTWTSGAADSLEEAFGASLGSAKTGRAQTMRARGYAGQMFIDARREIEAGARIDAALWEAIGTRYGLSGPTVERTVRAYARAIGEPLKIRRNRPTF